MDAIEALTTRRSIRSYTDQVPSDEQIDLVVKAVQNAPGAQPLFITIVTNKELIAEMDEVVYTNMLSQEGFGKQRASLPGYRPFYGAPAVIVISAPVGNPMGGVNAACACTAGCVAATALGLGSCFVMGPRSASSLIPDLKSRLQIPETHEPFCGVLLGYTDDPEKFKHLVEKPAPVRV